ncbi:MAG: response regulator transcription factor [Clostridia bacterium]|nr:response regulator transcription factor [Clostridia bacterium]
MERRANIYIVEDDEGIAEVYESAFETEYDVRVFPCAKDFFEAFALSSPDLIILDLMLPDTDGYTILAKVREKDERVPVIIVSARSDEMSFVKGLNKGADDYMAKPFSVLELTARVKSKLRRAKLYVERADGFTVDNNTYEIFYDGAKLELTLKEFKLLRLLIGKAGVTVAREDIFREVWGEDFFGETRTLDMHVASLREKIKNAGGKSEYIITVRGVGYRFQGR